MSLDLAARAPERPGAPLPARAEVRAIATASQARSQRERLERALASFPLRFDSYRDPAVERAAFPAMVRIFDELSADCLPPLQDEFCERVAALLPDLPRRAVVARASRTYPSLVRQRHFGYALREQFDPVLAGPELDMRGLDFLLLDEHGQAYGVGLSTSTPRSYAWHEVKARRHSPILGVPVLDLWADPEAYVVGSYWLHPPRQVEEVRAFVAHHAARRLHAPRENRGPVA